MPVFCLHLETKQFCNHGKYGQDLYVTVVQRPAYVLCFQLYYVAGRQEIRLTCLPPTSPLSQQQAKVARLLLLRPS
jgi:hypothetical protein